MGNTVRVIYRNVKGRIIKNIPWEAVSRDAAVSVTATQLVPDKIFEDSGAPGLGETDVYVTNVFTYGNGGFGSGVMLCLHVDGRSPVDVILSITHIGEYTRISSNLWGIYDWGTNVELPKK